MIFFVSRSVPSAHDHARVGPLFVGIKECQIVKTLPCLGITMGDPAGVGPEIIVRALADPSLFASCRPVVLGDAAVIQESVSRLAKKNQVTEEILINPVDAPASAKGKPGVIDLVPLSDLGSGNIEPGRPVVPGGKAMVHYILQGVKLALRGDFQGMVTGPISKVLMHKAGYKYDGHTQLIAHETKLRIM
jgi:4-hydroxy-L-threonine phosphate dehydrogenase PdxA